MKIKRIFDIFNGDECGVDDSVQGGIEFDNGWLMVDIHYQDCCESVYANWEHLKNEAGVLDYNFDEDSFTIESVEEGIRFGDHAVMFFVPCYNEQNGYYNSNLEIRVYRQRQNGKPLQLRRFRNLYAGTIDDIY